MNTPPPPRASEPLIRLSGIFKSFGRNQVLRGVDLEVERGETLAVLGTSGSGKSVLLKILLGLLKADRGELRVFETDAARLSESAWQPLRLRSGMLFQAGALFDSMSVFDNVAYPLRERGVPLASIRERVEERLSWVGLPESGKTRPSELSGGMRKRVALARAIVTDPELILYDEPTTGLDPLTGRRIAELIRDLDERLGSTSVVVTHDLQCASITAARWAFIGEGRIMFQGNPEAMRSKGPPEVKEFLEAGCGLPEPGSASREDAVH
jgi:phospholipid/cholesterol/gamma-HCH transport system ATP-binding protein